MKRDISKKVEQKVKEYFTKLKNGTYIKSNSSAASRNSK
jgi:hypothetical protein